MGATTSEISRIYLENRSGQKRRLINIVAVAKEGIFFEYKITFEGFKSQKQWIYVQGGVLDANKGLRTFRSKKEVQGDFTIGYHADGNIMYKSGGKNSKPARHTPIAKIKHPLHFLRMVGFSLDDLTAVGSVEKQNATTVTLENFSNKSKIVCDVYFSKGSSKLNFIINNPKVFRNTHSASLYDEGTDLSVHFHFYRTDSNEFYVIVLRPGVILRRIESFVLYWWYFLKDRKGAPDSTAP